MNASCRQRLLIANPSADLYGSDLQMLETVRAMTDRSWHVVIVLPADGPLVPKLRAHGADVRFEPYPVLRRAYASPLGMVRLATAGSRAVWRMRAQIRSISPCVVYVNTVTLPWLLLAGRLAGVPVVCHVHEAEIADRRVVRTALTAPLLLASRVITNGHPARRVATGVVPRLAGRIRVIDNGVAGPSRPLRPPPSTGPTRLLVLGRLSPRKATHVALDAVARLRGDGRNVALEVCGTAFDGYEWYVDELHERAARPDLEGAVTFSGYVTDVWSALERNHVLVAPSLGESLGNAVIQAQLAGRPVVATEVQGHTESVVDGESGVLVPASDVTALASAIDRLIDDPDRAATVAEAGRRVAERRFSPERYDEQMADELDELCRRRRPRHRRPPAQGAN